MPKVKFVNSLSEELIRECMANGMTYICDARTTEVDGKARPIEEDFWCRCVSALFSIFKSLNWPCFQTLSKLFRT